MSKSTAKFKISENQRRINEKIEILEKYSTSEEIFDALRSEIDTLSNDESLDDLSVGDEYNFGVEYEVELLMEVISDLRWFTRYNKDEEDESITDFGLDYIRSYFND